MKTKNTMLPENEVKKLEEIFSIVENLINEHTTPDFDKVLASEPLYRVHTLMYTKFIGDFISDVKALRLLLEMNEEEYRESIEGDGITLEDFEKKLMISMLVDMC